MSYLDSTLVIDKPAVVIDIGHAYTKCGFAGEASPHSIIPSKIENELNQKSIQVFDYKSLIIKINENDKSNDLNKKEETILRELLIEFLYRIYYKILNANARERRVIIIESILTPSIFRKTLADVLFKNFQAVSVLFLPSHLATLYTLGLNIGLVIDCGYSDCQIIPICESVPMTGLCDFVNLGAKRLHQEIESLIKEHSFVTMNNQKIMFSQLTKPLIFTEEIIEDIKLKCFFVTNFERSRQFKNEMKSIENLKNKTSDQLNECVFIFAPDCDYNLSNNTTLHIPGYLREFAFEIMFDDILDNKQTLPHLILDTLVKCPIDIKRPLSENVILIGGTCMLAGFKNRLVSEINFLLKNNNEIYAEKLVINSLKFHMPPSLDNYTAWLGGSIFGSLEILDAYSIQNSKYKDLDKLPDWFTIKTKNEMVHI